VNAQPNANVRSIAVLKKDTLSMEREQNKRMKEEEKMKK
jgi:hypothetical protein